MGRAERDAKKKESHDLRTHVLRQRAANNSPMEVNPSEYLKLRAKYGDRIAGSRTLDNGKREVIFKKGQRPPDDWR